MSTETQGDFREFNRFVTEQLAGRETELSLEESVAAFRAYQSELSRCRDELQPAIDELDAAGGIALDMDVIIARGKQQLAEEGISE
ncbi:MAG: hypothetical protein QF637_01340 [Acidimicrobiales bacterium]|jgi:hypothetical protein|nr:hypothetical protein [Acidimicrobiales bacterium]